MWTLTVDGSMWLGRRVYTACMCMSTVKYVSGFDYTIQLRPFHPPLCLPCTDSETSTLLSIHTILKQ
jgi:hypothetical protein